jgi:hypothetical protein
MWSQPDAALPEADKDTAEPSLRYGDRLSQNMSFSRQRGRSAVLRVIGIDVGDQDCVPLPL